MKRWGAMLLALVTLAACDTATGSVYGGGGGGGGSGGHTNTTAPWYVTYKNNTPGTNNSAVPVDDMAYDDNATVTVKGNSGPLVWNGWHFVGWSTEWKQTVGGQGTLYVPGDAGNDTFTITSNVTLWGTWAQN